MNNNQLSTLRVIFARPVPRSLEWVRIESLLVAAGARTIEGNGSRVRFELNGVIATFHRPHPDKEAKPYQVRDARFFLEQAGITP
ncbi:type II toxin-antitoxin system HicA family toxin [Pseudomonas sp. LS1212]|uniref:type II toxin-antitoxin system HicA family toxin n=1 Tax=Pseudomonas sp. LS1212 TaxID=2972478 RepID=UPI00215C0D96|nr:type II toxin-antitoxin system HicA family toxin [Pseudomonas sp. LS1212]UVJ45086.1 type II toxin-antitoxin system HicA family toxin [Pseudomonas sp. LS1212]